MQAWSECCFIFFLFLTQKRKHFFFLPYGTAADIEVLGSDGANDGPNWSVFVNLHGVEGLAENRRLAHIQHADLHCGSVLKRARRVKPVVKVQVGGLYFKSISLLCFKIQRLQRGQIKSEEIHSYRMWQRWWTE